MTVLLVVRGLRVERGGRILVDRLDLDLAPGEVVAVHGPSGGGKSSLLATLAGMAPPASGTVHGRGALMPQDLGLAGGATLLANAAAGALGRRPWWRFPLGPPAADRDAAGRLLGRLGIAHLGRRLARHVSGGERQRCALARTMLAQAPVLLLDEPVSQLDQAHAREVFALVRDEVRARGGAAILALHHDELIAACDRRLRIAADGGHAWS